MDTARKPSSPLSSLFAGRKAAKIIDFLLSGEQHQTVSEIHGATQASMKMVNNIIERVLDIDVVGIGARKVGNKDKAKDENTYYIRDDTDTGKSIRDLWYHLMQVQKSEEEFDSPPPPPH